jgi:2-aminophenol/2-amino-5-chlorophenol 1,6-dioxygenase alpha subunit
MPLVAAMLVPGSPLPMLRPDNPPWQPIVQGFARAREILAASQPEVLLLYSTQWIAVLDQLWQTRAHLHGLHVDENWYEFGDLPFDLRVNTALAEACVEGTRALGVNAKGVDYDGFPLDTGTIVAGRMLDPEGRLPIVLAANNLYHDWAQTKRLGAMAAEQAERAGKRYAVIGIGGLSGTVFRHEISVEDDHLATPADDALNQQLFAALARGNESGLEAECTAYAGAARADMGLKHLAFVLGAIGNRGFGTEVLGYGPVWGSGAAVINFTGEGLAQGV